MKDLKFKFKGNYDEGFLPIRNVQSFIDEYVQLLNAQARIHGISRIGEHLQVSLQKGSSIVAFRNSSNDPGVGRVLDEQTGALLSISSKSRSELLETNSELKNAFHDVFESISTFSQKVTILNDDNDAVQEFTVNDELLDYLETGADLPNDLEGIFNVYEINTKGPSIKVDSPEFRNITLKYNKTLFHEDISSCKLPGFAFISAVRSKERDKHGIIKFNLIPRRKEIDDELNKNISDFAKLKDGWNGKESFQVKALPLKEIKDIYKYCYDIISKYNPALKISIAPASNGDIVIEITKDKSNFIDITMMPSNVLIESCIMEKYISGEVKYKVEILSRVYRFCIATGEKIE